MLISGDLKVLAEARSSLRKLVSALAIRPADG
jgi:hypothetical protein